MDKTTILKIWNDTNTFLVGYINCKKYITGNYDDINLLEKYLNLDTSEERNAWRYIIDKIRTISRRVRVGTEFFKVLFILENSNFFFGKMSCSFLENVFLILPNIVNSDRKSYFYRKVIEKLIYFKEFGEYIYQLTCFPESNDQIYLDDSQKENFKQS